MVTLTLVLGTVLIWLAWFTLMIIPARWVCQRWFPSPQLKPPLLALAGLALMFGVYSQLTVMVVTITAMFGELFVLGPSKAVMLNLQRITITVTTALFFPPTFAALIVGYRRLRRELGSDGGLVTT